MKTKVNTEYFDYPQESRAQQLQKIKTEFQIQYLKQKISNYHHIILR